MSAHDRGWSIAPTLLWFVFFLVAGLVRLDHSVSALADRLTTKRDAQPTTPVGPVVAANPRDEGGDDSDLVAKLPPPVAGSHDIGALDDVCIEGADDDHCTKWAMDGFYRAVAETRKGTLGRALRVSWYGDSVVATDALPGELRAKLQAELGDGGPGFVYVLPPHRFCHHDAITRTGGDNFLNFAVSMSHTSDGFYGPAGAAVETNSGHAGIKLVKGTVTSAELYYLAQPHGGTASITADGTQIVSTPTAADAKAPGWASGTADKGAATFEIKGQGKVRLFGVSLENAKGAVVDNFGIVSVHVKSYQAEDTTHLTEELEHRSADLVMVMIGANEAQWLHPGDTAMKEYQSQYEKLLAPIRKARPDAACLVVSPTDQAEAKDDGYISKAIIPVLVDTQRRAAHAQGCAFYSTYQWMGGKGSATKWLKKHLVSADFIHLSKAGANKMADAVFETLMAGSKSYAGK